MLLLVALLGCTEPGPPVYPEMGFWEGPGVVFAGTGYLPVPYPSDDFIEYRAPLTWPNGEAHDYPVRYEGTGNGIEGVGPDLELEVFDDAIVARIRPWGASELPFKITLCGVERCALEHNEEFRVYYPGQGPGYLFEGSPAEGIFVHPDPPVLAVGERRVFQGQPYAAYPFGDNPDNSAPGTIANQVRALEDPAYTIADPSVATVSDVGVLEGISPGSTTLTITAGAASTSVEVTVTKEELRTEAPRGLFDVGARGHPQNKHAIITLDESSAPVALHSLQSDTFPNPNLWLATNTTVLAEWTGTGFGTEWLGHSNINQLQRASVAVGDDGRTWVPFVSATAGLHIGVRHRAGGEGPWTEVQLPTRPDLDRGEPIPVEHVGYPQVTLPVVNLGVRPASDGGAWVAYQFIYKRLQAPDYTSHMWDHLDPEQDCFWRVRLAHVGVDGTVEVMDAKHTDFPYGACTGPGIDTDSFVNPDATVHVGLEGPDGVPSLRVPEREGLGGLQWVQLDLVDGTWTETPLGPTIEIVDDHDPTLAVGLDPYGPVEGEPPGGNIIPEVVHEDWKDGVYQTLRRTYQDHYLPDRVHALVLDGLRLHPDDPDSEGRRLGSQALTPRFSHDPLVTDTCRLALNNADTSIDVAPPQVAAGRDEPWQTAALSGIVSSYPFEAERFVARGDGVYGVVQGGDLAIVRATDCQTFFALASMPDFKPTIRMPLLRDDGSVWVFTPEESFGGKVAVWDDPVLDPTGLIAASDLPTPDYVSPHRSYGIFDAGDRVVTFIQGGTDLAITEYATDGTVLASKVVAQAEPQQRRVLTNSLQRLDNGEWYGMRHWGGTNNRVELVRTLDFESYEVLRDDLWCSGIGSNESYSYRWCSSVQLADGRIGFAHQAPGPLNNSQSAYLQVIASDGSLGPDVLLRPVGGMTQGILGLHPETDGSVTAFLYDSNTYAQPIPGKVERYTDLVQNVVIP